MDQLTTAGLFGPYTYGRGYRTLNPTLNPAVDAPSILKTPGSRNFRVLSVSGLLTTSAAVANRGMFLEFLDEDGNVYCHVPANTAVAASTVRRFTFCVDTGSAVSGADGSLMVCIPQLIIRGGHQVKVNWSNADAADALSAMMWYYDELMIGGDGYMQGMASAAVPDIEP